MQATNLCIPIYLNQQVVFDLLAVLDDGFSHISTIRTATTASEKREYGIESSIGASNVFALLGISFSADRGKEKGSQEQTEISKEKIHTPTSLFAKLRLKLQELGILHTIDSLQALDELNSGEFIEFKAVLRKNPLVETIENFKELMAMALLFEDMSSSGGQSNPKKSKRKQTRVNENPILKQMNALLEALTQVNSVELIGELLEAQGVRAVITARTDFFSEGGLAEIIDGEFMVMGKVIRVVKSESDEPINLLRKTPFGKFDRSIFEQLRLSLAQVEEAGLRSFELVTEIGAPALLVIPIAVFT